MGEEPAKYLCNPSTPLQAALTSFKRWEWMMEAGVCVQQTDKKENMDCNIELLFCYFSVKTQDGLIKKYDQVI